MSSIGILRTIKVITMGGVDISFFSIDPLLTSQILLAVAYSFFFSIHQLNIYLMGFLEVFRADFLSHATTRTFVLICLSKDIVNLLFLSLKHVFSSISFIYRVCIIARDKE